MEITVPVSTHATIHVPATDLSLITEGGASTEQSSDVLFKEVKDGYSLFAVESGNYRFRVSK